MISCNVLFDENNNPISSIEIKREIRTFGESYKNTMRDIIRYSIVLDSNGGVFVKCASHLLKNFKMTRRGVFHEDLTGTLIKCWCIIGGNLIEINKAIHESDIPRDRFLLEVDDLKREGLIAKIWGMTKSLLPFTMSNYSYGLVGASKILFSVLPEIVLPTDNIQWKQLFKTVDLGDVIRFMTDDIRRWENVTGEKLNTLYPSRRLTTLPSVYNVVAMAAR